MSVGDHIKLHIDEGRRAVLGLPEGVGILSAVDLTSGKAAILVRYASMAVYVSPIGGEEIEVVRPGR